MDSNHVTIRLEEKRRKAKAIRIADEAIAQTVQKKILSHTLSAILPVVASVIYYFSSNWFDITPSMPVIIFMLCCALLNAVGAWVTKYRQKKGFYCNNRAETEEVILHLLRRAKD